MRKKGKYETAPVATTKETGSLLRAYVLSLMLLLVSCTMFIGTTAAWFTAEVTNAGNQIQVGVLSVDLLHGEKDGEQTKWTSLKTDTSHKVFGANELKWKPGSSDVQVLKVTNDGELLLGYQVTILADLASSVDRNGNGMTQNSFDALSEYFEVYCMAGEHREFDPEQWRYLGTLAQIMNGKPIYSGALDEDETDVFSVAIAMATDVDNMFMGHRMEMYLKLTAYQGGEGFIAVSGEEALRNALLSGGEILLLEDITFDEPMVVAADSTILFNGKNLTFAHTSEEQLYAFQLRNGAHLTLDAENATVSAQNGLVYIDKNTEAEITLRGGTYLTPGVTGEESGLIHIPDGEGVKLNLNLENITYQKEQSGWVVYFGDGDAGQLNMTMTGCAISSGHGIRTAPNGTVTIADSVIHAVQGLAVQALSVDGVTITNCELSAGYPGTDLNATNYIYTVATKNGGRVKVIGGAVKADENMYALAVLTGGCDITAEGCAVDTESTFVHDDAVGTVCVQ